jgi:hypothetical protein
MIPERRDYVICRVEEDGDLIFDFQGGGMHTNKAGHLIRELYNSETVFVLTKIRAASGGEKFFSLTPGEACLKNTDKRKLIR